jgi:predicted TIM-barrel fold metal-dependent hydrolase
MEARGFPLLFHVADPEEFWFKDLAPPWAVARGWFYGDDPVFPSKVEMYREVASVLDRHPSLKVIFAHFYFLSADLPRAADLLDTYPQVHLDICPGSEMYINFSARPDATRDFFLKYQDRLIYGSDMSASTLFSEPGLSRMREMERQWTMRMYLETDGPFEAPSTFAHGKHTLVGIRLPEDALRKIYQGNFQRIVGMAPASLNVSAAIEECQRLATIVEAMGKNPDEIRRIARVLSSNAS